MKDFDYVHNYLDGKENQKSLTATSIIIHRYYDKASKDTVSGNRPSIPKAAEELGKSIQNDEKRDYIPLSSKKGFKRKLYLDIQPWQ